ncbi:MAG: hypothetical protein ACRDV4_05350 [Acidimicrobiales bacterium]
MSSLWTPGGEHQVGREGPETRKSDRTRPAPSAPSDSGVAPGVADELASQEEEELASNLEELRRQLVSTPAEVVVANHAYGLFELAAIHLSQQPPRLEDARLAIDGMASLVEGLEGRLGQPERSLNDALAQIRLAFVQIGGTPNPDDDGSG